MEGERRKRKIENEEENDEEQKIERFFALIKRTKDVRDRFYKETKQMDGEREKGIWNPKFEVEDFVDSGEKMPETGNVSGSHHHHDLAGPSHKELVHEKKEDLQDATRLVQAEEDNGEEKDKRSEHLDLNLSL